jgi:hypothetical protein
MNRFTHSIAAFGLTTVVALSVFAATPTTAPVRSAVAARAAYDPFAMARAAQARPGTKEYEDYQHRAAIAKWLKDCNDKVKPPKPRPKRSPHKPPRDDDDDNGHGNNDDHDDDSNPGHGHGNHGTGNNGHGHDDDHGKDKGNGRH